MSERVVIIKAKFREYPNPRPHDPCTGCVAQRKHSDDVDMLDLCLSLPDCHGGVWAHDSVEELT